MARKKKAPDPQMEELVAETNEAAEAVADMEPTADTVSETKEESSDIAPEIAEVTEPPKRKRGRPRKKPLEEPKTEETPVTEESKADEHQIVEEQAPVQDTFEAVTEPISISEEDLAPSEDEDTFLSDEVAQAIADSEEYREDYLREQDHDIEDASEEKQASDEDERKVEEVQKKLNSYLASEVGFKNRNRVMWGGILIVCLIVVVFVGIRFSNHNEQETVGAESTSAATEASQTQISSDEVIAVTTEALTPCEDQELNTLMVGYYTAYAAGDQVQISAIVNPVTDEFLATMAIRSEYIDSYPAINVYTKPGPTADSYIAYVYTEVLLTGYNQNVPGLETYYICTDESGKYYINMTQELADNVAQYIHDVDLQEDVIDLNNKVTSEFNNLLTEDSTFASYYAQMSATISSTVAQTLAAVDAGENIEATESESETETVAEEETTTTIIVKATDVVNMRASDSEQADKVGKAQIGESFTLVEELANGWSKVTTSGGETVFIKSDYLEKVSEETTSTGTQTTENEQAETTTTTGTQYVTATTTVNVRKSASETGEKIATIYQGTKLELVQKQADGWTKVKYEGQTAYVKSDYVK